MLTKRVRFPRKAVDEFHYPDLAPLEVSAVFLGFKFNNPTVFVLLSVDGFAKKTNTKINVVDIPSVIARREMVSYGVTQWITLNAMIGVVPNVTASSVVSNCHGAAPLPLPRLRCQRHRRNIYARRALQPAA